MRHLLGAAAVGLAFCVPLPASASPRPNVDEPAPTSQQGRLPVSAISPDANPRTGLLSGPSVAVTASNDDSTVALTMAPQSNGILTEKGQLTWSLTLKAPLDKDTGEGSFITEQGISDAF